MKKIIVSFFLFLFLIVSFCYGFLLNVHGRKGVVSWVDGFYFACVESEGVKERWGGAGALFNEYDLDEFDYNNANRCKNEISEQCYRSDLYIISSFMARSNSDDFNIAFSVLDSHKNSGVRDFFTDFVFLDVSLRYAWNFNKGDEYYSSILSRLKTKNFDSDYFLGDQSIEDCDRYLELIGESYRRSGDLLSDFYIHLNIKN